MTALTFSTLWSSHCVQTPAGAAQPSRLYGEGDTSLILHVLEA